MSGTDVYRREIRFPRDVNHQLVLLQKEVQERVGKSVPITELVNHIVNQFFEKSKKVTLLQEEGLLSQIEEVRR